MLKKRVEDSLTEQTYLVMHRHINGYGRLFGGQLNFKHPAMLNDTLVMIGRVTYVGRTSMEVRVDSYVESLNGMRKMINRAYVVMVAIDEHTGRIKEVPGLIVETESQKAEWEGGIRRMALRKQRKLEGF